MEDVLATLGLWRTRKGVCVYSNEVVCKSLYKEEEMGHFQWRSERALAVSGRESASQETQKTRRTLRGSCSGMIGADEVRVALLSCADMASVV